MIKGLLLGFFCFILFLILHTIIFHYFNIRRRFVTLRTLFFLLIPLYTLLFLTLPKEFLSIMQLRPEVETPLNIFLSIVFNFCIGLGLYTFLWLGYCQFYFIIDRSISVRFMIEIDNSPNKSLSFEELAKVYTPQYIFSRRLEQMVDNGYLEIKDGKYFNTPKGMLEAKVFRFLKKFLQLGPGG